ncbi:hypothetical protein CDAR_28971 [Caerostris darwini]|uniref:Uncharacterized protein n=1 Tax=Caerostris darwini TaxID=1538125 RepID=A0AAV4N932_9ARAC|nr:hypothetical protein CDAR_28971 [Caerostris darwini]
MKAKLNNEILPGGFTTKIEDDIFPGKFKNELLPCDFTAGKEEDALLEISRNRILLSNFSTKKGMISFQENLKMEYFLTFSQKRQRVMMQQLPAKDVPSFTNYTIGNLMIGKKQIISKILTISNILRKNLKPNNSTDDVDIIFHPDNVWKLAYNYIEDCTQRIRPENLEKIQSSYPGT